jgi:predicted enzyme related to lactoylglutathione lyase
MMTKRVTSIGGIFFKCVNPELIREWYGKHLGISTDQYGTSFEWRKSEAPEEKGYTAWSPMKMDTKYFDPSPKEFMINYRVENLAALVEVLKSEGVNVVDDIETFEYGSFVHIMDPEGNKIELWEANDIDYEKMLNVVTK